MSAKKSGGFSIELESRFRQFGGAIEERRAGLPTDLRVEHSAGDWRLRQILSQILCGRMDGCFKVQRLNEVPAWVQRAACSVQPASRVAGQAKACNTRKAPEVSEL